MGLYSTLAKVYLYYFLVTNNIERKGSFPLYRLFEDNLKASDLICILSTFSKTCTSHPP